MKRGLLPLLAVGTMLTATGCPAEDDTCPTLPSGAEFEVTITELVSSGGCDAPTAALGDLLSYTIGSPSMNDEEAGCTVETGLPPAGSGNLYGIAYESCFEVSSGFSCSGHAATCVEQEATVSVTVGIPGSSLSRVGDERDGTYTVHLIGHAQGECPALSCLEKFKTHVKRLR